ncbi:MAG: aspartyl protease family protein [Gammaproteobacteria bacterium]|nr:aspartyl protease family protein [Gammaproteobacteria bacterium]MBU2056895.1 aspartyl protease family protein [Gammaproteobacteria bacterium]MBU2174573.1 aspartyl protease family protein [Gammaproteobacteria bacterium]MBU2248265.1 aspartyl protease family protein [Gammaproteobacteria bacterium]MBU2343730.1 aspartyl protease family protein [Gammaproteobacteria bacterium]
MKNYFSTINKNLWMTFTLLGLFGCQSEGVSNLMNGNKNSIHVWEGEERKLTIPFEWYNGHIIIPVSINGVGELRFAFDSGAAAIVLFENERTRSLQINVERKLEIGGGDKLINANVVNNNDLNIAGITLKDVTLLHIPLEESPLFSSVDEVYFDGAIGYDLLSRFVIRINYVRQELVLSESSAYRIEKGEWSEFDLDISDRVPYLKIKIKSQNNRIASANMMVDTGAPFNLYLNPDLHPDISLPKNYYVTQGNGFNGKYKRLTGILENISIGGVSFDRVATHYDVSDFQDLDGIGLIGNGVLSQFDVIFDYSDENIFLKKNKDFMPSETQKLDRSGIDIAPHQSGGVVKYLDVHSGASLLTIKVGDIVTHINHVKINYNNYDQLTALLYSDRKFLDVCWISSGNSKCGQLKMAERHLVLTD